MMYRVAVVRSGSYRSPVIRKEAHVTPAPGRNPRASVGIGTIPALSHTQLTLSVLRMDRVLAGRQRAA